MADGRGVRLPTHRIVVVDPVRQRALNDARRALLAVIRDPALRERLDGEIDVLAFRDGIFVKVPLDLETLVSANDARGEAAE